MCKFSTCWENNKRTNRQLFDHKSVKICDFTLKCCVAIRPLTTCLQWFEVNGSFHVGFAPDLSKTAVSDNFTCFHRCLFKYQSVCPFVVLWKGYVPNICALFYPVLIKCSCFLKPLARFKIYSIVLKHCPVGLYNSTGNKRGKKLLFYVFVVLSPLAKDDPAEELRLSCVVFSIGFYWRRLRIFPFLTCQIKNC